MKNQRNKKGFTLMEMLIVVAIIAILIAIAIPVFQAQLDKARQAVDNANMRSALSEAVTYAMTDDVSVTTDDKAGATYSNGTWTITFASANSTLQIGTTSTGYNQSKQGDIAIGGAKIQVTVSSSFVPTGSWIAK